MNKFFTLCLWKASVSKIVLLVMTVALIFGFRWAWDYFPDERWCQALIIFVTLALEDFIVLMICTHIFCNWKKTFDCDTDEIFGLTLYFLLSFTVLAIVVAVYAWVSLWLFISTIILALVLFFIGSCIIGICTDLVFGRNW